MSAFISASVLPKTNKVYDGHFKMWTEFVKSEVDGDDPFLRNVAEEEKASLVGLMMLRRHEAGHRGKAATSFTAGVRLRFAQETLDTAFLESAVIATARASSRMKPDELRARKDSGLQSTVKLPICESILTGMRALMWEERKWDGVDMQLRMTYLGCMWGFEMGARVSEYTQPEPGAVDHCVRTDDLTFTIEAGDQTTRVTGSALAALGLHHSAKGMKQITECRVRTVTSKGKVTVKDKLVARRSPEEALFLEDIVGFLVNSGAAGEEEMLSCRRPDGSRLALRSRAVRDELKRTCERNGLPPTYFSSHSLRKGAITHMRALGASEDDRRDRENYAPGSQVMNNTYDYATGLGPLASNSLVGGYKPTLRDVKRLIPPVRQVKK